MAGIYIHIPFCKSRCIYCGFYSTTALQLRQQYVEAIAREWNMRSCEVSEPIDTIYIGGGTPSQLTTSQLQQLFAILPPATSEVTIEVNPDDVTDTFTALLHQLPVNRVSMGAQTFDDQRLQFLHRRHSAVQVRQAVHALREAGIRNISIDLMYGFPSETIDDWQHDIDHALALGVEHISAYCLMIEEGTPLHRMGIAAANEETERQMYELLIDKLTEAGYEHYEISNFARQSSPQGGWRGLHNSGYWHDVPYIGLGAGAHSYDRKSRSWNVSDIRKYLSAMERDERPFESEVIDDDTHYNDLITTALRTSDGLDLSILTPMHRSYCLKEAQPFLSDGLLLLSDQRLRLTRKGLFVSDMIMASLMLV